MTKLRRLPPAVVIAEYDRAFMALNGGVPSGLYYKRGWFLFLRDSKTHYRSGQIIHMTATLNERAEAARELFAEVLEKVALADQAGHAAKAICVSRDIWDRMRAQAEALTHLFPTDPTKPEPETVMGLPVEHVAGRNLLYVRTSGLKPKG